MTTNRYEGHHVGDVGLDPVGVSGTVMQFVSQNQAIPADWFLSVRTLSAGIILLAIGFVQQGTKIFKVFRSWASVGQLVAYATVGLMANMYTFTSVLSAEQPLPPLFYNT